jgi:pimeloyl-ACP methyl ester carboxylesterase
MIPTTFQTLADGRRLRVARLGAGPPLVLMHGYPDNLQIWCDFAPRLADRFEVIAFDWPGMGYSDDWPGGATPMHMAERLRVLFDVWGLARAVLVGIDMGGQPALAFAALHPERTLGVVVMNSLLFGDEATSWEIRLLRRFGWNRLILRRLPGLVFRWAERTFLPRGVALPPDLRADLWDSFRRPEVRRFISRMCAGYQGTLPRLPELYARVRCPTLALWGERDKHFPTAHAERLRALVPGSRLEVVAGAEHWMPWHMADEVAARVRAFVEGAVPHSIGT